METISQYITYSEAVLSATAVRKGVPNNPPKSVIENMIYVGENLFDRVRAKLGPIRVVSFYRSPAVNRLVGGAKNSQHTKGQAIDVQGIRCSNREIFNYVRDYCEFDQLIHEFGTDLEPAWVHMSLKKDGNRKEVLQAKKVNGKTEYVKLA